MDRTISLITTPSSREPGLDAAVGRVLLRRASQARSGETFWLRVPQRIVAFGKRDRLETGYARAINAARELGFGSIERLAGGRAAVFHAGTLAFGWTIPCDYPPDGIKDRFAMVDALLANAFRNLGVVDVRVGEVTGEYCPGEHSINVAGTHKVMGVGQRLTKHAAHIGGVIVVTDSASVKEVLMPVYAHLGLDWQPETTGALEDFLPGVTTDDVHAAVITELSLLADLVSTSLPAGASAEAETLRLDHIPDVEI